MAHGLLSQGSTKCQSRRVGSIWRRVWLVLAAPCPFFPQRLSGPPGLCPSTAGGSFVIRSVPRLPGVLLAALLLAAPEVRAQQLGTASTASTTVTFSSPGLKRVTLEVCNDAGCSSKETNVQVLDPKPAIQGFTIPLLVGTGQTVTLQATTTGRPPLQHRWVFTSGSEVSVTGNPATWKAPSSPAVYLARLEVTNTSGSAVSLPVTVSVVRQSFADVPPTYWAWRFIESLATHGVTTGCGGGNYCPDLDMTRGEMALFLLRAKEGASYVPPPCTTAPFIDVPCTDPLAPWIRELVARGVTAGCGGGYYCPGASVTRSQMAVFLLATKEGPGWAPPTPDCTTPVFNDVPCTSPFTRWIKELVSRGITAGCGSGSFCPANNVTRGQMAVFLSTTFGLSP